MTAQMCSIFVVSGPVPPLQTPFFLLVYLISQVRGSKVNPIRLRLRLPLPNLLRWRNDPLPYKVFDMSKDWANQRLD